MGRKLILTGTKLSDLNAPRITDIDPIESAGSLLLMDTTHPLQQWADGVPAHATTLPNLLSKQAQSLVGAGADVAPQAFNVRMSDKTHGWAERTPKGGLHAIYSNTNADNIGTSGFATYFALQPSTPTRLYLAQRPGNKFYISLWTRTTRHPADGKQANSIYALANSVSSTGNHWTHANQGGITINAGASRSQTTPPYNAAAPLGNKFLASEGIYTSTTLPSFSNPSAPGILAYPFQVGNYGTINSYMSAKEAAPAAVFYRAYIEDLTVSGRTYAQVAAIDQALYNKEVLTPGGRFYGDTVPTDPNTIP